MRTYRFLAFVLLIAGCKVANVSDQAGTYEEDLTKLRPAINGQQNETETQAKTISEDSPVVLTGHINNELDSIHKIINQPIVHIDSGRRKTKYRFTKININRNWCLVVCWQFAYFG